MLKRVQMFGIIAWLIVASLSSVFAQTFTFQGYLRDSSGNPINQPAGLSMTFTLFNHPSNTGASFQVGSPITQSVPVRNGLFTVELNFGNVWDGSDRWLQIQIGSTTLIPRVKINPTPYAIRASTAGIANPIGSAGGDLSGAYPNPAVARLQGRAVSSAAPANGQVLKWDGSSWAPATDLSDTLWASSGGNIFNTNPGNVGIGTNTPSHKLEVNGDLLVNTSAGTLRVGFPSGANQWYLSTDGGGANLQLWENAANALRVYFRAGGNVGIGPFGAGSPPDYLLDVRGDRNARLMNIVNTNTGGFADGLYITVSGSTGWGLNSIANGADGIAVRGVASGANAWAGYFLGRGYFSDRVGIGTTSPGYILDVNGRARIRGATGTNSAGLWFSNGTNDRAFVGLVDDNTVGMWGQAGAGWHLTMRVDTGNVRIGPAVIETAKLNVSVDSSTTNATLRLHETAADFARLEFTNTNTARKWHIAGLVSSAVADDRLNFWNSAVGDIMSIRGDGTVAVKVLEITGADLAEKFPVTDAVEPGMVVEIDPDNPGNLRLARGAYSKRVVGVVAGANGLSKGIILGNLEGSEHHTPIAMSGRVWVYADATERAIEPGDFLTTADKPGYAMKADDLAKAQGAIIGKAMTRLEQGKTGMVLVVVNLQ